MAAYAFSPASCSTTSGTSSSTPYKSSQGSALSSGPDLASRLSRIDLPSELKEDEEKLKKIERAKRMVKEFSHGDGCTDTDALAERWLSELGVGWVLDLSEDPSAGTSLLLRAQRSNLTENWIRVLNDIIGSTGAFVLILKQDVPEEDVLEPVRWQLVFMETVLKMLPFVDALLAAADLDADATNGARVPSERKLQTLLDVRDAVSSASIGTEVMFPMEKSRGARPPVSKRAEVGRGRLERHGGG